MRAFISSTLLDLKEHRTEVEKALKVLGIDVFVAEDWESPNSSIKDACRRELKRCQLYICVVGLRYGAKIEEIGEISYTEFEFRLARDLKMDRLLFIYDSTHLFPASIHDLPHDPEKHARFIQACIDDRKPSYYKNAQDLALKVALACASHLHAGSTKLTAAIEPPKPWIVHPYYLLPQSGLIGREFEKAKLDSWAEDPASPIMTVHAVGGMGKSALAWTWFNAELRNSTHRWEGAFWWSFYEQNATFTNFILSLYEYVAGRRPEDLRDEGLFKVCEKLLTILANHSLLLGLDGFERQLNAYRHVDADRLRDELIEQRSTKESRVEVGESMDQASARFRRRISNELASQFFQALAAISKSKVLLTTRLMPTDFQAHTGDKKAGVAELKLRGLSKQDTKVFWTATQVPATDDAIDELFGIVEGYPLLLSILARQIKYDISSSASLDAWFEKHGREKLFDLPLQLRKSHILAVALEGLEEKGRAVLELIAALHVACKVRLLIALAQKKGLFGSELEVVDTISDLIDRGLVGLELTTRELDLHPIIRGVVVAGMSTREKAETHKEIQAQFEALPLEDFDDSERLAIQKEIVLSSIEVGSMDDSFNLFLRTIEPALRERDHNEYLKYLECFLVPLDETPISIHPVLNTLGKIAIFKPQKMDKANHTFTLGAAHLAALHGNNQRAMSLFDFHTAHCENYFCVIHKFDAGLRSLRTNAFERGIKDVVDRKRELGNLSSRDSVEGIVVRAPTVLLARRGQGKMARLLFRTQQSKSLDFHVSEFPIPSWQRLKSGYVSLEVSRSLNEWGEVISEINKKNKEGTYLPLGNILDNLYLSEAYRCLKRLKEARAAANHAIELATQIGVGAFVTEGHVLEALAQIEEGLGEIAETNLCDALVISEEYGWAGLAADAASGLMALCQSNGNTAGSLEWALKVVDLHLSTQDSTRGFVLLEQAIEHLEKLGDPATHKSRWEALPQPVSWSVREVSKFLADTDSRAR